MSHETVIHKSTQLDKTVIVEKSKIDKNTILYRDSRIINSNIGSNSVVGDFSRVYSSKLEGSNRIDRSVLIHHSSIGEYTYFGNNDVVMHSTIGKFCSVSWNVTIGPANHDYSRLTTHDFLYNDFYKIKPKGEAPAYNRFENKTYVGNDVWLGTNTTIINGVKIGDGVVVGANSVVTKDIPPYAIAVGNPARIIKYRFNDEIIKELLEIKWWDFHKSAIKKNYRVFKSDNINEIVKKLKAVKQ